MNKLILNAAAVICSLVLILISCGSEEEPSGETPEKADAEARKAPGKTRTRGNYAAGNRFSDHVDALRNSETPEEKIRNVYRLSRVRSGDRSLAVPFLADIMNTSRDPNLKIAASSSLIEIGTEESLKPVKKSLLFSADNNLRHGILRKLRKKKSDYKKTVAEWAAEQFNDEKLFEKQNEQQILAGLAMYESFGDVAHAQVDPEKLLQAGSDRVAVKMYEVMKNYPDTGVPYGQITSRISGKLKDRSISIKEIRGAKELFDKSKKDLSSQVSLSEESVMWGVSHSKGDMRAEVAAMVPEAFKKMSTITQKMVIRKLEDLAKNDTYFVEGEYPVRKAAQAALAKIKP